MERRRKRRDEGVKGERERELCGCREKKGV